MEHPLVPQPSLHRRDGSAALGPDYAIRHAHREPSRLKLERLGACLLARLTTLHTTLSGLATRRASSSRASCATTSQRPASAARASAVARAHSTAAATPPVLGPMPTCSRALTSIRVPSSRRESAVKRREFDDLGVFESRPPRHCFLQGFRADTEGASPVVATSVAKRGAPLARFPHGSRLSLGERLSLAPGKGERKCRGQQGRCGAATSGAYVGSMRRGSVRATCTSRTRRPSASYASAS